MNRAAVQFLLLAAALLLSGCERPHSDMGQQYKYGTYQKSAFFADGASARPPMAGTVARDDADSAQGVPADQAIPLPITDELIRDGQESFDIYCAACHGRLGNGQGMIVQRGLTRPPSFHIPRLKQAGDGHFYNVISNGLGAMFSLNDRITPEQRWEIIAYIRALQAAPDLPGAQISDRDRQALIARGDRKTPATGETQ